jgi:23S rRNA pseudouridine1911/1915/1917 synthase
MVLRYTAGQTDAGRKVYSILRRELRISQTLTRRLKQAGGIRVDGRPVFTDYGVQPGETVEIDISAAEPTCDLVPERGALQILYEDAGLIAVNKPPGLITHPSRARYTGTLSNFVAGYLGQTSGDARCHAVNRLDRDTSGIVLFAKSSYMKALASEALGEPDAEKSYLALIYGKMEPPSGVIDAPIRRLREGDMLRIAAPDGQPAVTRYETLGVYFREGDETSCLRLVLETGRTHQIRVHCLTAGHPVLGDGLYNTEQSREAAEKLGVSTQALHAYNLTFTEPITGEKLSLTAEMPEVFGRIGGL